MQAAAQVMIYGMQMNKLYSRREDRRKLLCTTSAESDSKRKDYTPLAPGHRGRHD